MSRIAKLLLVFTSLSPATGALAIIEFQAGRPVTALVLIGSALLLIAICYLIKIYPEKYGERRLLDVAAVKSTDKEALAFIIAYLVPILTGKIPNVSEPQYWAITAYVFAVIGLTVYHSNAFHFNPVLAAFGYHFYEVTADNGMTYLLIARHVVRVQTPEVWVTKLSDYVYLEVKSDEHSSGNIKDE
ncbi:hypothetical protein M4951_08325 [Blastopirellula sp. J2-11]|uniref:hypothetical protein n=1 Tax=Blastopirellula sp. J2-11 TaxID=2943192 RepID=UPI0021C8836B|nr:hypothetical protein [Blastopirellula sp. J2-11]UUO08307.1 hypothetical protein M4951_08325 [Blastopirellula sp. J2-11]